MPVKKFNKNLAVQEKTKIQDMLDRDMSDKDIGAIYGISEDAMGHWIRKLNLKRKKIYRNITPGEIFGLWEVIETIDKPHGKYKKKYLKCKCRCGTIKDVLYYNVIGNRKNPSRSCGCDKSGIIDYRWDGYEEISGTYWCSIKHGAIYRNIDFSITKEYAWNVFLQQNRCCKYSGIELFFPQKGEISRRENSQTASIDRIKSDIGYVNGNIQWVHKDINQIKMHMSEELFLYYINKIYKFQLEKYNNI